MDTATLVSDQVEDGARLIKALELAGFEITAAFWVLPTDEGDWHLYIASPVVENQGLSEAFGQVLPHLLPGRFPSITHSDIRLIGSQNPMVARAVQFRHQKVPLKFKGRTLGKMIIDEAYLYPREMA
ncbi:MAG: hypothetical protein WD045_02320 [Pirellulaceae bacterium]